MIFLLTETRTSVNDKSKFSSAVATTKTITRINGHIKTAKIKSVLKILRAKELATEVTPGLTQFALRQCRRDLRTLVYLLTGHNTLNRHLTIMWRVNYPLCPLCKEEDETSLHFLGKCCATANIRRLHFGAPFLGTWKFKTGTLDYSLGFAKTTKRLQ